MTTAYYHPKPIVHAAPPATISVPHPLLPPPPVLPQTPPVIQHQGAYAYAAPVAVPAYPAHPQHSTVGTHSSAAYGQAYSNTGPNRYTGYTRTRCLLLYFYVVFPLHVRTLNIVPGWQYKQKN